MAALTSIMGFQVIDFPPFPRLGPGVGDDDAGTSHTHQGGDDDNKEDIEDEEGEHKSSDEWVEGLMCWFVF